MSNIDSDLQKEQLSTLESFFWSVACDCLVQTFNKGEYRKIILPMLVIRRFDAVLEPTKAKVLAENEKLKSRGEKHPQNFLKKASKQTFYNTSKFSLKDLRARTSPQQLKSDFTDYINGFSENVQEIIQYFGFAKEIDKLVNSGRLHLLIEKFTSPQINLAPFPVPNSDDSVRLPALDNHSMGTLFEKLLRRFNEENNVTEAGEHFTPRDIVALMADLAVIPIADKLKDSSYLIYDGACGTGGILTLAEKRVNEIAKERNKEIKTYIYGQELNEETFAIAKSDLLIKGESSDDLKLGSTISQDCYASETFDFCISNPPFGTPWKSDFELWGLIEKGAEKANYTALKKEIKDRRFVMNYAGDPEYRVIPDVGDPQMLFLANNIAKMKRDTELGTRIVEVHNGSSLFTGDAGQGESNLRRYMFENDLVEAIVAMPEKMFYNTGIGTFLWILSNKKEKRRRGKVQLIDATEMKSPLRKNLGEKNCEFTPEIRKKILKVYMDFKNTETSKIFDNSEFGYFQICVERPLRLKVSLTEENIKAFQSETGNDELVKILNDFAKKKSEYLDFNEFDKRFAKFAKDAGYKLKGKDKTAIKKFLCQVCDTAEIVRDKNGDPEPNSDLRDNEQVPLTYEGGIDGFMRKEVLPYAPDAYVNDSQTKIGYELSFTKYFYKPIQLRELSEIQADIKMIEKETDGLLSEIMG